MEVINSLSPVEALTNYVYVAPEDNFSPYVKIDKFVYRCCPHNDIAPGHIAMNYLHRLMSNVFCGDKVDVANFYIPMCNFTLKSVTLCASWFCDAFTDPPELCELANMFRTKYEGHVLTRGQILSIMYGSKCVFLVVKTHGGGLVSMQTEIGVEWSKELM